MVTAVLTCRVFDSSSRTGKAVERSDWTIESRISTDTIIVIGGMTWSPANPGLWTHRDIERDTTPVNTDRTTHLIRCSLPGENSTEQAGNRIQAGNQCRLAMPKKG